MPKGQLIADLNARWDEDPSDRRYALLDDNDACLHERPHDYEDPEAEAAEFVASIEYPGLHVK